MSGIIMQDYRHKKKKKFPFGLTGNGNSRPEPTKVSREMLKKLDLPWTPAKLNTTRLILKANVLTGNWKLLKFPNTI